MRIAKIYTILLLVFTNSLNAQDNHIKYRVNENGYSLSINPGWNNSGKALRMDHRSNTDFVLYDEYFNRGIRRGNNILVTGDKPRFALLKYLVHDKPDPDMIKMGDGMISIKINDNKEWLHLQKNIQVVFNPGSTEYTCVLNSHPELKINLLVSQAKDWGAIVKLTCSNTGNQALPFNASLTFGGFRICGRTFSASYFSPDAKEDLSKNTLDKINDAIQISSSDIPGKITISQIPVGTSTVDSSKTTFSQEVLLDAFGRKDIYYMLRQSEGELIMKDAMSFTDAENWIQESSRYYKNMLNTYSISTPDKILDAGFKTAVLNFDNSYAAPAWLEGVHWWASYWTNNYQISAALSLGDFAKAEKALIFFNSTEYGPAPPLMLSGKAMVDSILQGWEDGLPYYLYQLIQYYNYTGEIDLLKKIWPELTNSIGKFWKLRDPDNNGLLNWHLGANAFLYQADHLGMPGDAASPSLIMAGMMDEMSVIAKQIGYSDEGKQWKLLSDKMYVNLQKILWDSKTGTFYSHKDLQHIHHSSHYYSDLVFPTLYTNLSEITCWQSLDYLYQTLWRNNYKGKKSLMHVGDYKPSLFGNDNVMPVQMAEAARAYFKVGDFDKGIKLLSSVALAGTVFTEAPGNFPERMNDEGKGEANYLFGNPIGSFIQSAINGLFGIIVSDKGNSITWNPSFPEEWNYASITLPYVKSNFKKKINNIITEADYMIAHDKARELKFSLLLQPCTIKDIFCNGKKMQHTVKPGIGKMQVFFTAAKALRHEIVIRYQPVEVEMEQKDKFYSNVKLGWKFNTYIDSLYDPQHLFKKVSFSKNVINGVISSNHTGHHSFFVKLKKLPVIFPVSPGINSANAIIKNMATYSKNKQNATLIDIAPYYNTDTVYAFTEWRNRNVVFDSSYFLSIDTPSKKKFNEFGIDGPIFNMAMINYGMSDSYTRETRKTRFPSSLTIPVNKKGERLSLLFINEMETRLTGATVGLLTLTYNDGAITQVPLTVGKNIDALSGFFATELIPVKMKFTDYAKIYTLHINKNKILKSFSIKINAADMELGLMGVKIIN